MANAVSKPTPRRSKYIKGCARRRRMKQWYGENVTNTHAGQRAPGKVGEKSTQNARDDYCGNDRVQWDATKNGTYNVRKWIAWRHGDLKGPEASEDIDHHCYDPSALTFVGPKRLMCYTAPSFEEPEKVFRCEAWKCWRRHRSKELDEGLTPSHVVRTVLENSEQCGRIGKCLD